MSFLYDCFHPAVTVTDPYLPAAARAVIEDYLCRLEASLPGLLEGFYLHGSLALGAFNRSSSDIDFVAVLRRPLVAEEVAQLRKIHDAVAAAHPAPVLEGSYLQWEHLGQPEEAIPASPCYHEGHLSPLGHLDHNLVTWWVLKERGIPLVGPPPAELAYTVDWNLLVTQMQENLNTYWRGWTQDPRRVAALSQDWAVEWCVLGVLRQFYTFRERDITSKTGAGEYALRTLPPERHRIVREAIHLREQIAERVYVSPEERAAAALAHLEYIIATCNELLPGTAIRSTAPLPDTP